MRPVRCRDALWDLHEADGRWFRSVARRVRGDALAVLGTTRRLPMRSSRSARLRVWSRPGPGSGGAVDINIPGPGRDTAADDVPASAVDMSDNATPSGWNLAAEALLTASALTADAGLRKPGPNGVGSSRPPRRLSPVLGARPVCGGSAARRAAGSRHRGGCGVAAASRRPAGTAPGWWSRPPAPAGGRPRVDGLDTAYVCRGFVCDAPTTARRSGRNCGCAGRFERPDSVACTGETGVLSVTKRQARGRIFTERNQRLSLGGEQPTLRPDPASSATPQ